MDGGGETTPYLTGRTSSLKVDEVKDILRNPDDSRSIRQPPPTPRGGEVYLYKIEDFEDGIWKKDNYHFRSNGKQKQPKTDPVVTKEFHKAYRNDKSTTNRFTKEAFYLLGDEPQYVLVHYKGDHSFALPDLKACKRAEKMGSHQTLESGSAVPVHNERGFNHDTTHRSLQKTLKRKQVDVRSTVSHNGGQDETWGDTTDIEYLGTELSPVKNPRLQHPGETNATCEVMGSDYSPYQNLRNFTDNILKQRYLVKIVQKILLLSKYWSNTTQNLDRKNCCLSLIEEAKKNWSQDITEVTHRLQWTNLCTDALSSSKDKTMYLKLIACVITGAYKTNTEIEMFLKTLDDRPPHITSEITDIQCPRNIECKVGRYTLKGEDLLKLQDDTWMTDDVLDAYLTLLGEEWCSRLSNHCLVLPTQTFLLWEDGRYTIPGQQEDDLSEYTWILMPINRPRNQHWVLLVANIPDRSVGVVNSKPSIKVEDEIMAQWRLFVDHHPSLSASNGRSDWTRKQYTMIEQMDGHSCGVFAIMAAESILAGEDPGVMRNYHSRWYRRYIQQRILQYGQAHDSLQSQEEERPQADPTPAVDGPDRGREITQPKDNKRDGELGTPKTVTFQGLKEGTSGDLPFLDVVGPMGNKPVPVEMNDRAGRTLVNVQDMGQHQSALEVDGEQMNTDGPYIIQQLGAKHDPQSHRPAFGVNISASSLQHQDQIPSTFTNLQFPGISNWVPSRETQEQRIESLTVADKSGNRENVYPVTLSNGTAAQTRPAPDDVTRDTVRDSEGREVEPGDAVRVEGSKYTYSYGIYVGRQGIVRCVGRKPNLMVKEETLNLTSPFTKLRVISGQCTVFPPRERVERAKGRIGSLFNEGDMEDGWDFSHWVMTGMGWIQATRKGFRLLPYYTGERDGMAIESFHSGPQKTRTGLLNGLIPQTETSQYAPFFLCNIPIVDCDEL